MSRKKDLEFAEKQCQGFILHAENSTSLQEKRDAALLNQDFYRGRQWTKAQWDNYSSKGITPHTINRCLPTIQTICGMQSQNSQEISVRPRHGGSEGVANVLTEIFKHTEDLASSGDEGAEFIYSELFRRGTIDSESYIKIERDRFRNINGQPRFKVLGCLDVDVDPNAKEYELNASAKYIIESKWVDKEELVFEYPDSDEAIKSGIGVFDTQDDPNGVAAFLLEGNEVDEGNTDFSKYRYRIREIWWKEPIKAILVVDKQENQQTVVTEKIAEIRRKAKKSARFEVYEGHAHKLHKTIMLGRKALDDEVNPYGDEITSFPYRRFAPHFDDGFSFGILDNIISLQKEENITRTQMTKALNQVTNSGWKVSGGTPKDKAELSNYGAVDGFVLDESKYSGNAEKIQPNQLPTGHAQNAALLEQDSKRITGIDNAVMGYDTGRAESGRAIYLKQKQGQVTLQSVFENLYRTLQSFGNLVLDVIRESEMYTEDEIRQVVAESTLINKKYMDIAHQRLVKAVGASLPAPMPQQPPSPQEFAMVRPEDQPTVMQAAKNGLDASELYLQKFPELSQNWEEVIKQEAIEMLIEELKSEQVSEYSIKVTLSPNAPTVQLANFMQLNEIAEKFPGQIPIDIFIEQSDLQNKEELLAKIKQAQQAQMSMMQAPGSRDEAMQPEMAGAM